MASSVHRPDRELKAFAKVALAAGASATVSLTLDYRAFAFYDTVAADWYAEPAGFELHARMHAYMRMHTCTCIHAHAHTRARTCIRRYVEPGAFELLMGASSDDIRLRQGVVITGEG